MDNAERRLAFSRKEMQPGFVCVNLEGIKPIFTGILQQRGIYSMGILTVGILLVQTEDLLEFLEKAERKEMSLNSCMKSHFIAAEELYFEQTEDMNAIRQVKL